jgi:hypothetical protein
MCGVMLTASQIGGGIAPLVVVPIQIGYGWRAAFLLFGLVGVAWAAALQSGWPVMSWVNVVDPLMRSSTIANGACRGSTKRVAAVG